MRVKPWMTGPKELLEHAIEHLKSKTPFDCRISMISVDNAVEIAIKTYLSLPKRVRGSKGPSKRCLQEASDSFPGLLDLLQEYGPVELEGVDLGEIEWYHRQRNKLYHETGSLTIDSETVDAYLQIAKLLLKNLLGAGLEEKELPPQSAVGEVVLRWSQLEHNIRLLYQLQLSESQDKQVNVTQMVRELVKKGVLSENLSQRVLISHEVRNRAVHRPAPPGLGLLQDAAEDMHEVVAEIAGMCHS